MGSRQATHQRERFLEALLAAEEQRQRDARIRAGFPAGVGRVIQILDAFLLASAQAHEGGRGLHRPGQAASDVVVHAHDGLGVGVTRGQPEHLLMITPRPDGVAQSREPRLIYQRQVLGAQAARQATRVERLHVLRIPRQPRLGKRQRPLGQFLDLGAHLGIEGKLLPG